jgi:aspartyl-tRNA(Asn)/glutamyl-tRNA(Gln) amidotransferase subunit C
MKKVEIDVNYVAQLARLKLSEEETSRFQSQLSQVLGYVEQLDGLDVSKIEPTAHAFPQFNVYRKDEIKPSLPVEEALQSAPQKLNDLFKVPKVIES